LDIESDNSLKQQSTGCNVSPLLLFQKDFSLGATASCLAYKKHRILHALSTHLNFFPNVELCI